MTATGEVLAGLRGADAFMVLGLPYSPDLTDAQVRTAYLLRIRAVHPDNGGDTRAAAAVTAAYDALRSPGRRGELLTAVTIDRDSPPAPVGRPWWRAGRDRAGNAPGERADRTRPGTGRVPDAARREELWRKMAAARVEQGLPRYITDEATLDKIADLLVGTLAQDEAGRAAQPGTAGGAAPRATAGLPPMREGRHQRPGGEWPGTAGATGAGRLARGWLRVRYGRPWALAARVALAAAVVLIAQAAVPGDPAVWALGTGAMTWLARTARYDLAPRARR